MYFYYFFRIKKIESTIKNQFAFERKENRIGDRVCVVWESLSILENICIFKAKLDLD